MGLFYGGPAGANVAHYIISRTITGFAIAAARTMGLEPNAVTAPLATSFGTLFAQFLLLLLAPPNSIPDFLGDTIGSAVTNGVLAMPVFALLNRILGPLDP